MTTPRTPYPTDVTEEEWAFVAPYLTLLPKDAGQRTYSLRDMFNGLRWIVRACAPWRMMPNDLPPWSIVYQQTQRWLTAGCFATIVDDVRLVLREAKGRTRQPSAAIFDSRTIQSTPEIRAIPSSIHRVVFAHFTPISNVLKNMAVGV